MISDMKSVATVRTAVELLVQTGITVRRVVSGLLRGNTDKFCADFH
ncbi:hypothetical protein [Stomatobaculum longum]|nr:hypothetical protein [Stomatobaculum longum]